MESITLVDPKTGRVEPLDSSFYIMLYLREKSGAREWWSTSSVCKKWAVGPVTCVVAVILPRPSARITIRGDWCHRQKIAPGLPSVCQNTPPRP